MHGQIECLFLKKAAESAPNYIERWNRRQIPSVKTVRIAGFLEQFLGFLRVIRQRFGLQGKIHDAWNDHGSRRAEAQTGSLVNGLSIDGVVGRQTYPLVMPGRLRVPLLSKIEPLNGGMPGVDQDQLWITLDLFSHFAFQGKRDVSLAPLEHGQAGRPLGYAFHNDAFDIRGMPPVRFIGLQDQFYARRMAHELIRAHTDRMLFEAVLPHLLQVFLGHDYPRCGRRGAIEGHEVGPGLMHMEAHRAGIYHLNVFDLCLEFRRADPFVACEAKDNILSSTGITVVELQTRAQLELVRQAVWTFTPRLRQG